MDIELSPEEARVIGALIEKEITTPDQYPLSLHALTQACNQKSNRDPVMTLPESAVQDVVDGLMKRRLVAERSGFGSRVPKYQQRFCNTEFSALQLSAQERGVLCVLLLRGAQTPGELRTRSSRLCGFADVHEVEAALEALMKREDGPFVARLAREPGRRESRYAHLFGGPVAAPPPEAGAGGERPAAAPPGGSDRARIGQLESLVSELRGELEEIKRKLERIEPGGDPPPRE